MLSDLEVLQNAERSLMDENEPFEFSDWTTCTCGHIYHGVVGKYAPDIDAIVHPNDGVYVMVMEKVAEVLELGVEDGDFADAISSYTDEISNPHQYRVEREDALKVIREAIEKIREMDLIKIRDAHNYEVVNASQSH